MLVILSPIYILSKIQAFILLIMSAFGRLLLKFKIFDGEGGFLSNDDDDDETNDDEEAIAPPSVEQLTDILYGIYVTILLYIILKFTLDQIIALQQLRLGSLQAKHMKLQNMTVPSGNPLYEKSRSMRSI